LKKEQVWLENPGRFDDYCLELCFVV